MILGTYRSEEAGPPLERLLALPGVLTVSLDRLDEDAVLHIVGDMLALDPAPTALAGVLTRHSEGNPFFVAEYLRTAVADGLLYRDTEGYWQVGTENEGPATTEVYAALPLPRSLRELVARRLDGLSTAARTLVEVAAALGREVESEILFPASGLPEPAVAEALEELLIRHVMEEMTGARYRFLHDRIREVAYERVAIERRPEVHLACALAIERTGERRWEELGAHWERAGRTAAARTCYLSAATRAVGRYALAEAEGLYRAYLRLCEGPTPESVAARNELGSQVLQFRGLTAEALAEHGRALVEAREIGDAAGEGRSLMELAHLHRVTGQMELARDLYEQAIALHRAHKDTAREANSLGNLANLCMDQGRMEEARSLYGRTLEIHRASADRKSEGVSLVNLAVLNSMQGRFDEARQLYEEGIATVREAGNLRAEGAALLMLAILYSEQEKSDEARPLFEQALEILRRVGDRPSEALALFNVASARLQQGLMIEAREIGEQALALQRMIGDRRNEALCLLHLARLQLFVQADPAAADALACEAQSILEGLGVSPHLVDCLCLRGHIAITVGKPGQPFLERACELGTNMSVEHESLLGQRIAALDRSLRALADGERLVAGMVEQDLWPGVLRWMQSRDRATRATAT
ncbi:MAG: tetratricopeptide repeat protein [Acidobacteriota bacterium]